MRRVVLLVLLMVGLVSCGRNQHIGEVGGPATATIGSTAQVNDPALTAAAGVVQPLLESRFAGTHAGLEIRNEVPMMVIYRKPDPTLDAEVRKAAPDVRIEFRDARHHRVEMMEHVKRVMDDTAFWKDRGVEIAFAGPAVDGSGVQVGVTTPIDGVEQQLEEQYPAMSFTVEASGKIVPAPATEPVPVFPTG